MRIESATDLRRYVRQAYPDNTADEQRQIYQAIRTHPERPKYCVGMVDDYFGRWKGKGTDAQWRKFLKRFDAAKVIG